MCIRDRLRPFEAFVLPMIEAIEAGREFDAMNLLRKHCPSLAKESLTGQSVSELLARLRGATHSLAELMAEGSGATNREVLVLLRDQQLITLDPRILGYLDETPPTQVEEINDGEGEEDSREITAMEAFLACPAEQFRGFRNYIQQQSPFSTQQGIKGAEFERVLVVLDDDEGTHVQFSYDKYFEVRELSRRDLENIQGGKETAVDRTRRLFYVCCTRALKDLVVIYFSTESEVAERKVVASGIFPRDCIFNYDAIVSYINAEV